MIKWTEIEPLALHESQADKLRFRKWPALDVVDRAEELVAEFGEEIFDAFEALLTLRALNEADKAVRMRLLIGSVRTLFTSRMTGKTSRRYMIDYFNASEVEREVEVEGKSKWVRLVHFDAPEGESEPSKPNVDGLGDMNIGITTGLLWHLGVVHFGPLFAGRLSKAAEKDETSSDDSSQLAETG